MDNPKEIKFNTRMYYGIQLAVTFIITLAIMLLPSILGRVVPVLGHRNIRTVISLALLAFFAFFFFPKVLKIPVTTETLADYLHTIGLKFPKNGVLHILLGVILAMCSLGGMLAGSVLSGNYIFNPATFSFKQIFFALIPGFSEEFFYRGVIMIILLVRWKSVPKAFLFQCFLFTLAHFSDPSLEGFFDTGGVLVLALLFTFTAWKTGTLIAGMVFHFLHDAFVFVVQNPEDPVGLTACILFYGFLTLGVIIGLVIVFLAAEKIGLKDKQALYIEKYT